MRKLLPLAVAAGVAGATLTGIAPATAASPVDCAASDYTRTIVSYVPTNVERLGVDGRAYAIMGPQAATFEVCVDIPDGSTFTIEARIRSADGTLRTFRDDRPGDKIFRFTPGANSFWQTFGTMTGPPSTYIYYTWRENQTPV